ncbi:Hypothetical predicted protein [Pelobates cultripes]|uniref:Uncharacterized protein n=1 Tax=Pelobates cultripes TaxID=61616 RepID=A0AAD1W557_PELCU|nr:Hypothetical predicted protein [Pelobates cultripes]
MSQRQKAKAAKADRASFFLDKSSTNQPRKGHSPTKDGGDTRSEGEPPPSPGSSDVGPEDDLLTIVLTPETPPDQLIIDRAHRLRRPKHLPNSAARDVIVRVHFYHAKERSPGMPEPYQDLKLFTDLSAATLQFRKSLTPLMTALCSQGIAYCWGYPAKLLIHYQDTLHAVDSLATGKEKFRSWGLAATEKEDKNKAKIPRMSPEWTPA